MQVKKGDFVYDPFVGTGSILVAASHYGAQTFGADIDIRIVRDGKPPRLLPSIHHEHFITLCCAISFMA
jgi:tRNA G10  N-methylase Trm11